MLRENNLPLASSLWETSKGFESAELTVSSDLETDTVSVVVSYNSMPATLAEILIPLETIYANSQYNVSICTLYN